MDAAHLSQIIAFGGGLILLARFVLGTLDRAEAGFASLFVPPDRTLPWPHGVQESDAPWGWHPPLDPLEAAADSTEPLAELPDDARLVLAGHATYVERARPVAPIRFRALPQ